MFNKKLKEENNMLKKRIELMEIKICNGNHKWVEVSQKYIYTSVQVDILKKYICSECGKTKAERW